MAAASWVCFAMMTSLSAITSELKVFDFGKHLFVFFLRKVRFELGEFAFGGLQLLGRELRGLGPHFIQRSFGGCDGLSRGLFIAGATNGN